MRITFVRHAQTIGNKEGKITGQSISPLSKIGEQQARDLSSDLKDYDAIFSSPMKRTLDTLKLARYDIEIIVINDLIEMNMGILQGVKREAMSEEQKMMYGKFSIDGDFSGHNGESPNDFVNRCIRVFNYILSLEYDNILVCTHYGVMRAIISKYLGLDKHVFDNAQPVIIESKDDIWRLI